jgi:hypothetical protein
LRVHPDLLDVLTKRSEERGITRSQYVEKLLIGWANIDPRNRRLELVGKVSPTAPSPWEIRRAKPLEFADRWQNFCKASLLLLGSEPPREWFEEWEPWDEEGYPEPPRSEEPPVDDEALGPSAALIRKRLAKLATKSEAAKEDERKLRDRKPKGT